MATSPRQEKKISHTASRMNKVNLSNPLSADEFVQLTSLLDDPKVVINVGPELKAYSLSKKLLCHESKYFSAAFEGGFLEGSTQTMTMEEDDPHAFDLLIQFIYTKYIVLPKSTKPKEEDSIHRCLSLLRLADKIGMGALADATVSKIKQILERSEHIVLDHLRILLAEDWPTSKQCLSVKTEVISRLAKKFAYPGPGELHPNLQKALREIPGLAHEVLLSVRKLNKDNIHSLWPEERVVVK